MNNINSIDLSSCYGCESCSAHCPTKAITMVPDKEGFLYPNLDEALCIGCGLCIKQCPIDKHDIVRKSTHNMKTFSLSLSDDDSLLKSSSGGAAYSLMKAAIENKYFVCGVSYDSNFCGAKYEIAHKLEEIDKFRGTKYIQARKSSLYKEVLDELKEGRKMLFIGLPCEVAAAKLSFESYESMIVYVEITCHGVTSPLVAKQYIDSIKNNIGKLSDFTIRYKKYGWTPGCIKAIGEKKTYVTLFDSTEYGYAFRNLSRKSCYQCEYKGDNRGADITIGDFWGAQGSDECWNKNGVSIVFIHDSVGQQFLSLLKNVNLIETSYEKGITNNSYINKPRPLGKRELYSKAFTDGDIFKARKACETNKERIIRLLRNFKYEMRK